MWLIRWHNTTPSASDAGRLSGNDTLRRLSIPCDEREKRKQNSLGMIERVSFECRKVIGFALSTPHDWRKRFAPLFHPIRSKTKTNRDALACIFPRFATATCNYFGVLIGSLHCLCSLWLASNYFRFGFTTLNWKPLYCVQDWNNHNNNNYFTQKLDEKKKVRFYTRVRVIGVLA